MLNLQRLWTFIITASFFRLMWRRRGFYLRFVLCWVIGLLSLSTDEVNSYDWRFDFRGEQNASTDIVIINLDSADFARPYTAFTEGFKNIEEWTEITDGFFWNSKAWSILLKKVLQQNPQKVGITFNFGDNITKTDSFQTEIALWKNEKVLWARKSSEDFLDNKNLDLQTGYSYLQRDNDGVLRRITYDPMQIQPHFVEKLTQKNFPFQKQNLILNFRGHKKSFAQYRMTEVLQEDFPKEALKDKIVLIGTDSTNANFSFLTPLGLQSRTEVLAHVADNLLKSRWVTKLPNWFYKLYLFLLTVLTVYIIINYPQPVGLVFLLWTGTSLAALSAWVFDSFSIWLPIISPLVLLSATWIIFVGYQANKIERQNYRLQQEQQYLQEIEQLKNNFVSLISHDLKTPIAKIQAIIDRLMMQNKYPDLNFDLKNLRDCSDELNRYIQSVLKLLRIEARDLKINKEVADINDTLQEAIEQLRPLAEEKQIQILFQAEPLFSIEFDVTLIKEVAINLIENAIKYSRPESVITIKTLETGDFIEVQVSDQGEGIPEEDLDKVWGKFTRGTGQELKTKGTGLGLYLVKYFVELHGGHVHLESQLKKGTKVSFQLPLETT